MKLPLKVLARKVFVPIILGVAVGVPLGLLIAKLLP